VTGQTFYQFQPAIMPAAAGAARSHSTPGSLVSICDSPAFRMADEVENAESNPDGLGAARAVRSAFCFELFLVMTGYGIWHLMHLAH
jgi:hypothetical protein